MHLLAILLSDCFDAVGKKPLLDVEDALQRALSAQASFISDRFDARKIDNQFVQRYKGQYLSKLETVFGRKDNISDIDLERKLQAYYAAQPPISLSDKDDLVAVVNQAFVTLGISETVDEGIAYTLALHSGAGKMYPQWEAMVRFMEQ